MNLRICFMGVIASLTGEKELALDLDGAPTLRGLLTQLEERYGPEFGARVYRSSTAPRLLQMCTRIFINGNLVDDTAMDRPLPSPSEPGASPEVLVYLLPAACGG